MLAQEKMSLALGPKLGKKCREGGGRISREKWLSPGLIDPTFGDGALFLATSKNAGIAEK